MLRAAIESRDIVRACHEPPTSQPCSDRPRDRAALERAARFLCRGGRRFAPSTKRRTTASRRRARPAPAHPSRRRRGPIAGSRRRRAAPPPRPLPATAAPGPRTPSDWRASRREAPQRSTSSRRCLAGFEGCALKFSAKNLCFCRRQSARPASCSWAKRRAPTRTGSASPSWAASGQLLDRMLAAIGLDRTPGLYRQRRALAPARQPRRRRRRRSRSASPSSQRQIELADPEFLVCLGGPSAQKLLGVKDGHPAHPRSLVHLPDADGRDIRALPTLHPAYLLRQPLQKRLGWRDFTRASARARRKNRADA